MTVTLALNENNDIYLGADGNIVVASGADAVKFACINISQARLGEMFLQQANGLPFFETVFSGNPNLQAFENALKEALESVDGVIRVTSLVSTVSKGKYSYTATIQNQYGPEFTING